ncbi:penicillin-binding protein 2, partial [bacterium]|nr:penicillin-binding protein 2 [bacterium]
MVYGPGYPLEIEIETARVYPHGDVTAHIVGYMDEIDPGRLQRDKYEDYRPGDLVGKTGIEEYYEEELAGRFGKRIMEVNARGVPLRELSLEPGVSGRNLVLNLDVTLMTAARRAIGTAAGAVVVMDPRDGAVLASYSSPNFAPEMFLRPIPHDVWNAINNNERKPLYNKFLTGQYPPGSTFKAITALAGLESGVIKPGDTEYCPGKWRFGGRDFRCHSSRGHGYVNLQSALVHSCDVYFYKKGYEMGIDLLAEYGKAMGYGVPTGIDLGGEYRGVMPNKEWKSEKLKERWLPGDTLSASIGQGYDLATPLQVAVSYAAIANGGTVFQPRVVHRIENQDGSAMQEVDAPVLRKLPFKKRNLDLVTRGLIGVVNDPGGTGRNARLKGHLVAGKTGTSQVRAIAAVRKHISQLPYKARDHAWFAAFAPAGDPEIVVVVLAEHSGHGGVVAAPIAQQVLTVFFRERAKNLKRQKALEGAPSLAAR